MADLLTNEAALEGTHDWASTLHHYRSILTANLHIAQDPYIFDIICGCLKLREEGLMRALERIRQDHSRMEVVRQQVRLPCLSAAGVLKGPDAVWGVPDGEYKDEIDF